MKMQSKLSPSVILEYKKCTGCTACVKGCPTNAIRVRNKKAVIKKDLCIDCGECIRVCPSKAKKAVYDHFDQLKKNYKWSVVLVPPSLYGQFSQLFDVNFVLTGLINMGFNDVFEVSRAAEIISLRTKSIVANRNYQKPLINSSCPVVVKLIESKYPDLLDNIIPVISPVKLAARMARDEAVEKTGYASEDIGVFFISPCPGYVTEEGNYDNKSSELSGILSINEIYLPLLKEMNKIQNPTFISTASSTGIEWAITGGEAAVLDCDKYLSADGIENIIKVLDEIENERLIRVDFAELNACTGGCVGGVFTVENPFLAKTRIIKLSKEYACKSSGISQDSIDKYSSVLERRFTYRPVMTLDNNILGALEKIKKIEKLTGEFPGLDCGACGAPSCKVLAEDIVNGWANKDDCPLIKST
ncbi:[Fe-Fe] hydrogenase large subunit C-terminal domain-containing protein [Alloiococcus sp. CFN-8]|uniref:[Fe-Fe] hydrogenase large subunit C-terminal domain-containing protein n=1 Tax=Alloiococcus sp. CFN-8 TaxID=3416081 RepID=UPI003CF69440